MKQGPRVLVFRKRPVQRRVIHQGEVVEDPASDPVAQKLEEARAMHVASMEKLQRLLEGFGATSKAVFLSDQVDTSGYDLVIALGGDGTVLHASHQIGTTPVLAINSAPKYSVGFLTATSIDDVEPVLERAFAGKLSSTKLQRMAVDIDGKRVYGRVLNDVLFSHECPASTSRYIIELGGISEEQLSSGIWVGPAAGSTAAQRAAGGQCLPPGSKKIQFIVREPYSRTSGRYSLVKKLVPPGEKLRLRNLMDTARLYVDGPHVVIPAQLGELIELHLSEEPLRLLGFRRPSS